MSYSPSVLGFRRLALGAALLGCSLASTEALGQGMVYTTVNSFTVTMTAGSASVTYTLPGPTTGFTFDYSSAGTLGQATGDRIGSYDVIGCGLGITSGSTSASFIGTVSLTFSQDMTFSDFVFRVAGISSGWLYGGSAVNDGDLFVASGSPYVFTINYSYTGTSRVSFLSFVGFQAATSAVPLPGAAALAAGGLLGLTRRRRR
jgi:hypothetical protein